MPVSQVTIANGSVINNIPLSFGGPFQWANPATVPVRLTGCAGFATQDTYDLPAAAAPGGYGLKDAQLLLQPTSYGFSENPNQWNAPGMPRISTPPYLVRKDEDVA